MTFLSPWSALVAGAAAIPLLVLLYLLRLRRTTLRIPSTLLWNRSAEDLQANVPFQRLRWSLLLFLQMLALVLLLLALAEPAVRGAAPASSRLIIIIDRSASMQATDVAQDSDASDAQRTRFDEAKARAREIIDDVGSAGGSASWGTSGGNSGGGPSEAMIIAFGRTPTVVAGYTRSRSVLRDALDALEPTDEVGDLQSALDAAAAFALRASEQETDGAEGAAAPAVVLLTDGAIDPPSEGRSYRLRSGAMQVVMVGSDGASSEGSAIEDVAGGSQNIGITAFDAQRDFENPGTARVFARLINTGIEPVQTLLTLEPLAVSSDTDGEEEAELAAAAQIERVVVPAAGVDGPGERAVVFTIDDISEALLVLRQNVDDALSADDTAALVLPQPMRPRIALVQPGDGGDAYLRELLDAYRPRELAVLNGEEYAAIDARALDRGERFDLVFFDRVAVSSLPGGPGVARVPGVPSITFGAAPSGFAMMEGDPNRGRRIVSWQRSHPVMRHVELDDVVYAGPPGMMVPERAEVLARGPEGPVIALFRGRGRGRGRGGAAHIVVGFALGRSTWPAQVSVTVFLLNALDVLRGAEGGEAGLVSQPGEALTLRVEPGASRAQVRGPVNASAAVDAASDRVTLPPLRLAGVYAVDGARAPLNRIAVSVLSDQESDIRRRGELRVNAENVQAQQIDRRATRPIWQWFVLAALLTLIAEWLVYSTRLLGRRSVVARD